MHKKVYTFQDLASAIGRKVAGKHREYFLENPEELAKFNNVVGRAMLPSTELGQDTLEMKKKTKKILKKFGRELECSASNGWDLPKARKRKVEMFDW